MIYYGSYDLLKIVVCSLIECLMLHNRLYDTLFRMVRRPLPGITHTRALAGVSIRITLFSFV